jgi:hypothetical protein
LEKSEGKLVPLLLGEPVLFHQTVDQRTLVLIKPLCEFGLRCIKLRIHPFKVRGDGVFSIKDGPIDRTVRSRNPSFQIVVEVIVKPLTSNLGDLWCAIVIGHASEHSCKHKIELTRQPLRAQKTSGAERKRHLAGEGLWQSTAVVEDAALARDVGALWEHQGNVSPNRGGLGRKSRDASRI